ncbi:hypothetical protein AAIH28_31235, partial [Pseudomonas aeruginosa]
MRKLLFSEVVRIVSHLSIEMFSSAGDQGDLDFYVPLDVECESLNVTLSVPFLAGVGGVFVAGAGQGTAAPELVV